MLMYLKTIAVMELEKILKRADFYPIVELYSQGMREKRRS